MYYEMVHPKIFVQASGMSFYNIHLHPSIQSRRSKINMDPQARLQSARPVRCFPFTLGAYNKHRKASIPTAAVLSISFNTNKTLRINILNIM